MLFLISIKNKTKNVFSSKNENFRKKKVRYSSIFDEKIFFVLFLTLIKKNIFLTLLETFCKKLLILSNLLGKYCDSSLENQFYEVSIKSCPRMICKIDEICKEQNLIRAKSKKSQKSKITIGNF